MPFYKWIIDATKCENRILSDLDKRRCSDLNQQVENDVNGVANRRIVNVLRQLSQLVQIADDVFASVYNDCRALHDRTEKLRVKVKHCEQTLDKLNAKTIPVPLGALSGKQLTTYTFASCHEKDVCLLSPASRPPTLDRLHRSADGPSSLVLFPPGTQVGKTADGRPGSSASSNITHIYCQPLELDTYCSSLSSAETLTEKPMSSIVEVPSTVVPIDVSGQHFSRMASFRRSLIHVDFLIRRKKKKDKRRNTVSEGETKELKEVLQKIAIENQLPTVPKSNNILVEHNHINQDFPNTKPDTSNLFLEEKNNNSISKASIKSMQNGVIHDSSSYPEQNADRVIMKKTQNCESTSTVPFMNRKKKPRSHLPISTSSAAMTVAVKMRQTHNGVRSDDGQSSSGNWSCSSERTSSDSDQQKSNIVGNRCDLQSPLSNSEDSLLTDNSTSRKMQYKSTLSPSTTSEGYERKAVPIEIQSNENSEISSYLSSEYRKNSVDGDGTSTTASVDTDAIFISSGESDDELSDLSFFQETFGSSTSLSTISNGSLNSLLSRTGTEMSSSTGTLTSICQEPLPTPPPPPPKEFTLIPLDEQSISSPSHNLKKQKENSKSKLPKSPRKGLSKTSKNCAIDLHKAEQSTSKSLFASLVSKKPQHKVNSSDKHKLKETSKIKRIHKVDTPLQFDMYGNQSPRKTKQVPIFIKENVSPIIEKNKIHQLQSFCPDNSSSLILKNETDAFLNDSKESDVNCQLKQLIPACSSPAIKNIDLQSYDVFSDASEKPINEELVPVPLKYGHQITVTPIRRHASIENYSNDVCRRSRILTPSLPTRSEASSDLPINVRSLNSKSVEINESHKIISTNASGYPIPNVVTKPQRPATLVPPHATKPTARVVLDPEGRVVYSTNSLDRHTYNVPYSGNILTHSHKQSDPHPNHLAFAEVHQRPYKTNYDVQHHSISTPSDSSCGNSTPVNSHSEQYCYSGSKGQYCVTEQNPPASPVVMEFYPSHKILPSRESSVKVVYPVAEKHSHMNNSIADTNGKYNFTPVILCNPSPPDPNISGLPLSTSMLTQKNVNLHSQHLERLNTPPTENNLRSTASECSYLLSTPPPLYNSDSRSLNGDIGISKQSSMSTEDLFAVIHNCKKRLNIKTDSDHSLASSSRSSSPSCVRPTSSKGCLAETGFLSPRNSYAQCDSSRDRRSWADFRSPPVSSGERKSFASDRLGPTKPTSMHDFKMLLLQTRTSTQPNGQRKSAAELLKVPVSKNNTLGINTSPMSLSPRNSISFTTQNSPTSDTYLYNGHSTVPFKRGNRARASLQPRYMMYPPIFEDCLEETENGRELGVEDRNKSKQLKNDGSHNRSTKNNSGASSMWV